MRYFKCLNPKEYANDTYNNKDIYPENYDPKNGEYDVEFSVKEWPKDWEEVFPEKILDYEIY